MQQVTNFIGGFNKMGKLIFAAIRIPLITINPIPTSNSQNYNTNIILLNYFFLQHSYFLEMIIKFAGKLWSAATSRGEIDFVTSQCHLMSNDSWH